MFTLKGILPLTNMAISGADASESKHSWTLLTAACGLLSEPQFWIWFWRFPASAGSLCLVVPCRKPEPDFVCSLELLFLIVLVVSMESHWQLYCDSEVVPTRCSPFLLASSVAFNLERRVMVILKRANMFLGTLMIWVQTQLKSCTRTLGNHSTKKCDWDDKVHGRRIQIFVGLSPSSFFWAWF